MIHRKKRFFNSQDTRNYYHAAVSVLHVGREYSGFFPKRTRTPDEIRSAIVKNAKKRLVIPTNRILKNLVFSNSAKIGNPSTLLLYVHKIIYGRVGADEPQPSECLCRRLTRSLRRVESQPYNSTSKVQKRRCEPVRAVQRHSLCIIHQSLLTAFDSLPNAAACVSSLSAAVIRRRSSSDVSMTDSRTETAFSDDD